MDNFKNMSSFARNLRKLSENINPEDAKKSNTSVRGLSDIFNKIDSGKSKINGIFEKFTGANAEAHSNYNNADAAAKAYNDGSMFEQSKSTLSVGSNMLFKLSGMFGMQAEMVESMAPIINGLIKNQDNPLMKSLLGTAFSGIIQSSEAKKLADKKQKINNIQKMLQPLVSAGKTAFESLSTVAAVAKDHFIQAASMVTNSTDDFFANLITNAGFLAPIMKVVYPMMKSAVKLGFKAVWGGTKKLLGIATGFLKNKFINTFFKTSKNTKYDKSLNIKNAAAGISQGIDVLSGIMGKSDGKLSVISNTLKGFSNDASLSETMSNAKGIFNTKKSKNSEESSFFDKPSKSSKNSEESSFFDKPSKSSKNSEESSFFDKPSKKSKKSKTAKIVGITGAAAVGGFSLFNYVKRKQNNPDLEFTNSIKNKTSNEKIFKNSKEPNEKSSGKISDNGISNLGLGEKLINVKESIVSAIHKMTDSNKNDSEELVSAINKNTKETAPIKQSMSEKILARRHKNNNKHTVVKSVTKKGKNPLGKVFSMLTSGLGKLVSFLGPAGTALAGLVAWLAGSDKGFWSVGKSLLSDLFSPTGAIVAGAIALITRPIKTLTFAFKGIKHAIKGISEFSTKITPSIIKGISLYKDGKLLSTVVDKTKTFSNTIVENVKKFSEKILGTNIETKTTKATKATKTTKASKATKASKVVKDASTAAKVSSTVDEVAKSTTVGSTIAKSSGWFSTLKAKASNVIDTGVSFVKKSANDIAKTANKMKNAALSRAKKYITSTAFFKMARPLIKKYGLHTAAKMIAKKIPIIGIIAGGIFGIQRLLEGDLLGAGLEVTSGILGGTDVLTAGAGFVASSAIDIGLVARDIHNDRSTVTSDLVSDALGIKHPDKSKTVHTGKNVHAADKPEITEENEYIMSDGKGGQVRITKEENDKLNVISAKMDKTFGTKKWNKHFQEQEALRAKILNNHNRNLTHSKVEKVISHKINPTHNTVHANTASGYNYIKLKNKNSENVKDNKVTEPQSIKDVKVSYDSFIKYPEPSKSVNTYTKPVQSINTYTKPVQSINTYTKPVQSINTYTKPVQSINTYTKPVQSVNNISPNLQIKPKYVKLPTYSNNITPTLNKPKPKQVSEIKPSDVFNLSGSAKHNGVNKLNSDFKHNILGLGYDYKQATGHKMNLTSAYRSVSHQRKLFDKKLKEIRSENPKMSYAEAYAKTRRYVAPPGNSAHNLGLAVDINPVGRGKPSPQVDKAISLGLFEKYGLKRPVPKEAWHIVPKNLSRSEQLAMGSKIKQDVKSNVSESKIDEKISSGKYRSIEPKEESEMLLPKFQPKMFVSNVSHNLKPINNIDIHNPKNNTSSNNVINHTPIHKSVINKIAAIGTAAIMSATPIAAQSINIKPEVKVIPNNITSSKNKNIKQINNIKNIPKSAISIFKHKIIPVPPMPVKPKATSSTPGGPKSINKKALDKYYKLVNERDAIIQENKRNANGIEISDNIIKPKQTNTLLKDKNTGSKNTGSKNTTATDFNMSDNAVLSKNIINGSSGIDSSYSSDQSAAINGLDLHENVLHNMNQMQVQLTDSDSIDKLNESINKLNDTMKSKLSESSSTGDMSPVLVNNSYTSAPVISSVQHNSTSEPGSPTGGGASIGIQEI